MPETGPEAEPRNDALESPVRRAIVACVKDRPGIQERDLRRILDLDDGPSIQANLCFHVEQLIYQDRVHRHPSAAPWGQARLIHTAHESLLGDETLKHLLTSPHHRTIALVIHQHGPAGAKEVARLAGCSLLRAWLTIGWLRYKGLVVRDPEGYVASEVLEPWTDQLSWMVSSDG